MELREKKQLLQDLKEDRQAHLQQLLAVDHEFHDLGGDHRFLDHAGDYDRDSKATENALYDCCCDQCGNQLEEERRCKSLVLKRNYTAGDCSKEEEDLPAVVEEAEDTSSSREAVGKSYGCSKTAAALKLNGGATKKKRSSSSAL